jgi:hypothetical protein
MAPRRPRAGRATTVAQYLATLPPDRRRVIAGVRAMIRRHLPAGYRETMAAGMITYEVPLSRLPDTYNGHALWYAALGSNKGYCTLHLMAAYASTALYRQLEAAFKAAGKKFDMGKACLRFQALDDLPLDEVGRVIAAVPIDEYIASYQASRKKTAKGR